jgi:PAS domain S-box-containing protein
LAQLGNSIRNRTRFRVAALLLFFVWPASPAWGETPPVRNSPDNPTVRWTEPAEASAVDGNPIPRRGVSPGVFPEGGRRGRRPPSGVFEIPKPIGWLAMAGLLGMLLLTALFAVVDRRRRKALKFLEENERLHRTLVDHIDLGIALIDADFRVRMRNPALERLFPAQSDPSAAPRCFDHRESSLAPCADCPGLRALETGEPAYSETRAVRSDGVEIAVAVRAFPLANGPRKPAGFIEVVEDITARKETEKALRSENAFRAGVIECAAEGICVCHEIPEFPFVRFTVWNERMREITGYALEEINQKGWHQSLYPDPAVREAAMERMARMRAGDNLRAERWEMVARNGAPRVVTISTSVLEGEENTRHVLALMQDVTDQVRTERELREREKDLRTILDSIGDAVIAGDSDNRVARMNPAAERLTGWPAGEALGRPISDIYRVVDEDDRRPVPLSREPAPDDRLVLLARGETERRVAETMAPLTNERGAHLGRVIVFRDITDRVRLEDQLHQARKMEAIGQLAGGVAHDFNNMLGGILGAAEMMELRVGADPQLRRLIDLISKGAQKASDLTQKLLAFGRKGKARSTPVDLHAVIRDAVHLLERSIDRRIAICLDLAAPVSVTTGDPAQIQNALLNLGINARDAMPDGGRVTIGTRIVDFDQPPDWPDGLSVPPGEYVEVTLSDTGPGIPEAIRNRIFEPFFTTKETGKGTGLGLAAVFGALQEHRGGLRLETWPGRGAAFHLYFRLVRNARPEAPSEAFAHRGRGRILLVDDESLIRSMGADLLVEMGYEVRLASDGQEALEVFQREGRRIDLVILDMVMPRLNGRDAFFAIRRIDPEARVLLSSGFSHGLHMQEALDAGAVGFVQKPYTRASLGRMLSQVLPGAPGTP